MKRILVPLDGSKLAEAVLPAAARIATALGAELLLFHVIEASPPGDVHGERHLTTASEAEAYLADTARKLAGAAPMLAGAAPSVAFHVHEERSHDPARAIGEHVDELRSDLVVLATHGVNRFGRFLRGSVAQRALFFGGAPVLTIPSTGSGSGGGPGKNASAAAWALDPSQWLTLLVAVDASGEHGVPLAWAAELARGLGLSIEFLLVVDTNRSLRGDKMAIARSMPGATRWALEAAVVAGGEYLAKLETSPELAGLAVRTGLVRGSADKALTARVRGRTGDIVVIDTHGRSGLGAAMEGSMAARILARLSGPVLLVPAASIEGGSM
jgi:nucleotide-binding universal stress UspA family protein